MISFLARPLLVGPRKQDPRMQHRPQLHMMQPARVQVVSALFICFLFILCIVYSLFFVYFIFICYLFLIIFYLVFCLTVKNCSDIPQSKRENLIYDFES